MRNLKVALVAACAVVVGWAFTASAATIHVATYGDDGENDGSAARPYATIAKAIGLAQADDEIRVAGGVYTEALVSTVERLTISGSWTKGFAGRDLVNCRTVIKSPNRSKQDCFQANGILNRLDGVDLAGGRSRWLTRSRSRSTTWTAPCASSDVTCNLR